MIITPATGALAIDTGVCPVRVAVRLPQAAVWVQLVEVVAAVIRWVPCPRGPPAGSFLHPASRTRFAACGFLAGGHSL